MKNWTLRQRILASFAVIIAIMLLMVVVSYSRLLKIESSEASVREDALPGLYYSSMIRGAWSDSYVRIQAMLGLEQGQGFTVEEAANFNGYAARLKEQMDLYRGTIADEEDRVEYAAFEKLHEDYHRILAAVIELHKRNQEVEAIKQAQVDAMQQVIARVQPKPSVLSLTSDEAAGIHISPFGPVPDGASAGRSAAATASLEVPLRHDPDRDDPSLAASGIALLLGLFVLYRLFHRMLAD